MLRDKNGVLLDVGDMVNVGDPKPSDLHEHEFHGEVIDIDEDAGTVTVLGQDDEAFDVDADNVEVA